MRIGVLGVQGAVSEHISAAKKAMHELGLSGYAFPIRDKSQIPDLDALILPGGESTTITRLSHASEISQAVRNRDLPIMGTCAGLIMLASESDGPPINQLGLIGMSVTRNAFGSQKHSCEATIDVGDIKNFPAVFIRAPAVKEITDKKTKPIATFQDKIVGVQKNNIIALSFHPELTGDTRIHKKFLESI